MNKWIAAVVITVAVFLAGIGLLFGMGIVVEKAVAPVTGSLQEVVISQRVIQKKLDDSSAANLKALFARVETLEQKVRALESRGVAAANPQRERPQMEDTTIHEIPVGASAVFGKADAPVTIVVFNDFQCPFCSRFYPAVMEAVKAYPGQVKLVMKHFPLPFHPTARPAAKAALAAGVQGKFYEMADLLFLNNQSLTEDKFKELAGQLKLNVDQFMKDYKSRDAEWEKQIEADMDLGNKSGVRGTPSYYLNGKAVQAGSPDQWKSLIASALNAKPVKK